MATSPAPDAAAPPGMCPGIAVLGGGGGSGDGSGDGSGGKDGSGGDGSGNGEGAGGDGKGANGAPDYQKYPECGYASHPVDVVTGRAFTHPITDLELPGPLPLTFQRMYSSKMAERDVGLGYGWAHTFGWEVEVGRRGIRVWNEQGIAVDFPMIEAGAETLGPWGWLLRREEWGFAVDADDGLWHLFSAAEEGGKRYRLTAIEDRNRNRIALTYENGRLIEVKDSAGRIIRVLPTKEGRIGSIQVLNAVAQGRWIAFGTYTYDEGGNLVSVRDAGDHVALYAYDDEHRLTDDTDRVGLAFHFVYDAKGRCVESWGDYHGRQDPSLGDRPLPQCLRDGITRTKGIHHCKFDYQHNGYTEVADATEVRRFFGNKHGTLDKRIAGDAVISATYDGHGHLLSRTDAVGGTVTYTRDARGRLLSLADPLGRVTNFTRGADGLPVQIIDPTGGVTIFTRDKNGNPESITDPCGGVTTFRYNLCGLVTERVDSDGDCTRFEYDAHGNMTTLIQPNGGTWRYVYDALGRRSSVTDPCGATSRFVHSVRGDLVAFYDASGGVVRYEYDGERQLTRVTSPAGKTTELEWGGYHQLCGAKDPSGHQVRIVYDAEGQAIAVVNESGEEYSFEYSPQGRLIAERTFDGVIFRYRYDAEGNLVQIRDPNGKQVNLSRNLAGELVARELSDGTVETIGYDLLGNIASVKSGPVEVRVVRDLCGRIVREEQIVRGEAHTVESRYDTVGKRVARSTSLGYSEQCVIEGDVARILFNATCEVRINCDLLGREVARDLPRGGRIESTLDFGGRVTRRRVVSPSARRALGSDEPAWLGPHVHDVTAERAYQYNMDGELIEMHDTRLGATRYDYDPVGQIIAAVPERARPEFFRFDALGNLHEEGDGASRRVYGKGNRLLRRGDTEYRWNDLGQLVEKVSLSVPAVDAVRYEWNAAGQLAAVVSADGTRVDFIYDAFGRRLEKRVTEAFEGNGAPPVVVTRFVWDADVLVHEIKQFGNLAGDPVIEERTYRFENDGFIPLAHRDVRHEGDVAIASDWFQYLNDPAGNPERLVGTDGEVVCEFIRSTWGTAEVAPGAKTTTPLRLLGQYEDVETGLHYNRFRYYDPEVGRYISHDPLGLDGELNLYRYPENPYSRVDPLGLAGACTCKITTRDGTVYDDLSHRRKDKEGPHNAMVQAALDKDHTTAQGKGKGKKQGKGECAEPNAMTKYLDAKGVTAGDKKGLKKALRDIASIEPTSTGSGDPKEVCPYCRMFLKKLGGKKLLKKVKPASLLY